jgi:hypothetical protein
LRGHSRHHREHVLVEALRRFRNDVAFIVRGLSYGDKDVLAVLSCEAFEVASLRRFSVRRR